MKKSLQEQADAGGLTLVDKPEGEDFVLSPEIHEPIDLESGETLDDPFVLPEEDDIDEMATELYESKVKEKLQNAKTLDNIKDSLIGKKGLEGWLFHINSSGNLVRYYTISDLGKHAKDIGRYVQNLINENEEWPGGTWFIEVRDEKNRKRGFFDLLFPEKPKKTAASSEGEVATSAIKQSSDMMDKVLQLAHEGKGDNTLLIEVLKSTQGGQKDSAEEMVKMLTLIKAMNPPKEQNTEVLTTLITALSPIVLAMVQSATKKKELDPIQMMAALKDISGNNPQDAFSQALEMFNRVSETVNSNSPSTNPVHEILKQVMPHVGGVLENVTGGLKEVIQLKRESLALQAGNMHGRRQLLPPASEAMPISSQSNKPEDTATMHPTMKKIYDAVINKDATFYSELETIIKMYMGEGDRIIDGLTDSSISVEAFVDQISNLIPQFNEPEMKAQMIEYMEGFIVFKLEEFEANNFIAKCDKCGHEVAFGSEQEYNEDEDKGVCMKDGCTGQLQPLPIENPFQEEEQVESPSAEEANDNGSKPPEAVEQGAATG